MDKELQQLNDLKARFSYMFAGPHIGLDIYRGWLIDFVAACETIDALLSDNKIGFHFSQTKEKHGWARYYFDTDRANLMRVSFREEGGIVEQIFGLKDEHEIEKQIAEILFDAERKSMTKCMACGDTATIRTYGGWDVCACEKHSPGVPGDHLKNAAIF